MRETLLRRLALRLAPDNPSGIQEQLERTPELQGELHWLSDLLDAADLLSGRPVPPELSASLRAMMPVPSAAPRTEAATPIHDSRTAGELVGVRGGGADSEWTVMYTAVSADIALDGSITPAGTHVAGQILARLDGMNELYLVTATGPERAEVWTDELGQFELGLLPAGDYRFSAASSELELRWTTGLGQ